MGIKSVLLKHADEIDEIADGLEEVNFQVADGIRLAAEHVRNAVSVLDQYVEYDKEITYINPRVINAPCGCERCHKND